MQPGYLMGHGAFFATGLPGGIDYAMLVSWPMWRLFTVPRLATVAENPRKRIPFSCPPALPDYILNCATVSC